MDKNFLRFPYRANSCILNLEAAAKFRGGFFDDLRQTGRRPARRTSAARPTSPHFSPLPHFTGAKRLTNRARKYYTILWKIQKTTRQAPHFGV